MPRIRARTRQLCEACIWRRPPCTRVQCTETAVRPCAATPHNLHTPIAAARVKQLFPEAKLIASLKDPVDRFKSAYNQFGKRFVENCNKVKPAEWCPIFKYFRLQLPTYAKAVRDEIAHLRAEGVHPLTRPAACKRSVGRPPSPGCMPLCLGRMPLYGKVCSTPPL